MKNSIDNSCLYWVGYRFGIDDKGVSEIFEPSCLSMKFKPVFEPFCVCMSDRLEYVFVSSECDVQAERHSLQSFLDR